MEVGQYAAMRDVPIKSSVKVDTHGGRPTSSYEGCTNLSKKWGFCHRHKTKVSEATKELADQDHHKNEPTSLIQAAVEAVEQLPSVGIKIEVYWPDDDAWYPGYVAWHHPNGTTAIQYEDGYIEKVNLAEENFVLLELMLSLDL